MPPYTWSMYHKSVGLTPNPLVVSLFEKYNIHRGRALDLGAGNLRDAHYLIEQGFEHVVAVDSCPASLPYVTKDIDFHQSRIQSFHIKENYFDCIIACNSLFFLDKNILPEVFASIYAGLRVGGVFACNILAPRDEWILNKREGVSSLSLEEAHKNTLSFSGLKIQEEKYYGETSRHNQKHWNLWTIVGVK